MKVFDETKIAEATKNIIQIQKQGQDIIFHVERIF